MNTQTHALIAEVERLTRVVNQQAQLLQAQDLELKQLRDVLGKMQQDLFKCHG